jgi:hypothetical protein
MNPSNAEDGTLWQVDDRGKGIDLEHTQVCDGKGRALQIIIADRAIASLFNQSCRFSRNLPQTFALHIAQNGHNQASIGVHGYGDIYAADWTISSPSRRALTNGCSLRA